MTPHTTPTPEPKSTPEPHSERALRRPLHRGPGPREHRRHRRHAQRGWRPEGEGEGAGDTRPAGGRMQDPNPGGA
jgi:hypothetical protein